MKHLKITKVEVSIPKPQIHQITAQSHPEIWAMLQPPETKKGGTEK
ncbi:hypothetical protein QUB25_29515 [Microcoleus sp. B3-D7]